MTGKTIMRRSSISMATWACHPMAPIRAGHYTQENVVKQLNKYLSYGIGTVASFGQDEDPIYSVRDAQHAGTVGGARMYTGGHGFLEYTGKAYPNDSR